MLQRYAVVAASLSAVALLVAVAWYSPILPPGRTIPGSVLSLAEHRQISQDILPVPHLLADYNVHRTSIRNSLTEKLKAAGFNVVDEPDGSVPELMLQLSAGIHEEVPDAVLCVHNIRF